MSDVQPEPQVSDQTPQEQPPIAAAPHYAQGHTTPLHRGQPGAGVATFVAAARQDLAQANPHPPNPPAAPNDCAGIVQFAAAQAGVNLGKTVADIWGDPQLTDVPGIGHASYGDLVFTGMSGNDPQHIEIFLHPRHLLNLDRGNVHDHIGQNVVGIKRLPS